MISVKRPTHQFVFFRESLVPDIREVVRGRLATTTVSESVAVSLPAGKEHVISEEELVALTRVSSDRWTPIRAVGVDGGVVERLVEKGLLLGDGDDPTSVERRRQDEKLARQNWYRYAALYHYMSKWEDVRSGDIAAKDLDEYGVRMQEGLQAHLEAHEAPPHFHRLASRGNRAELPIPDEDRELYRLLAERKTHRVFDRGRPLELRELSVLLYYVYGCHGIAHVADQLSVLRKTSPSGGSLHPIEVYPLLLRVKGVECGLYHYDVSSHALARIRGLAVAEAERLADELAAGQIFARDAAALFLVTARFHRNFWKYREHAKAYRVVLMDAAHLSQTFYLVCADLGLGAFFTTAINERNLEAALGVDDVEEGALAISGCGRIDPSPRRRPFSHGPYDFPERSRF